MKYRIPVLAASCVLVVLVLVILLYTKEHYTVTTVYVDGNIHYTNEEIKDAVMQGFLGNNSLFLSLKYADKGITDMPFIQTMDVEVLSPDTIRIMVYEKALAGYIEYLGKYMYFDRDGIIVEASDQRTEGIPQVTGLTFDHVIMHEVLPVSDPKVFEDILDITQLMNKYDIAADRINFDRSFHKTLYFDRARVALGSNDNIGEKIMRLSAILPELKGRSGVLRMDNYSESVRNITFEVDKEEVAEADGEADVEADAQENKEEKN